MAGLLGEVTGGGHELRDATAKAVNAVQALGDVTVLCAGASARDAAAEAAKIAGVARVLVAENPLYGRRLAEPTAALMVSLAGDYSHIAAPATTDAKNVMPRVAALLDAMVISDVSAVIDADTLRAPDLCRQRHPDGEIERRKRSSPSARPASFDAAGEGGAANLADAALRGAPAVRMGRR
ncbi:MAG: hypothetical protein U1E55_00885 [Paracoccus sp. (in: a-proteobacteria)]